MSDEKIIEVMEAGAAPWMLYSDVAQRILHALRDAGYEVVPREPTEAMVRLAANETLENWDALWAGGMYVAVYRAMLSASTPSPENA